MFDLITHTHTHTRCIFCGGHLVKRVYEVNVCATQLAQTFSHTLPPLDCRPTLKVTLQPLFNDQCIQSRPPYLALSSLHYLSAVAPRSRVIEIPGLLLSGFPFQPTLIYKWALMVCESCVRVPESVCAFTKTAVLSAFRWGHCVLMKVNEVNALLVRAFHQSVKWAIQQTNGKGLAIHS